MAWDAYSDNIRKMNFKAGGIFDLAGNPWTQFCDDPKVQFNPDQIPSIQKIMSEGAGSQAKVFVKDVKQQIIIADENTLVGKKGDESSIVAIKCKQCILIGVGGEKSEPRQLLGNLATLGEHISSSGY